MRFHLILLLSFALAFVGCAEKEEAAAEIETTAPQAETGMEAGVPEPVDASELEAAATNETTAVIEGWRDEALLDLMHVRAERLDEINYALADGDLEAARMPAKWLAEHKRIEGLPDALLPFVDGMREAAGEIEGAEDVDVARASAQRIVAQCQACHAATGAIIE